MPTVVGGLAALVALGAGMLAEVDSLTSLWRSLLAFVLGWFGTHLWYVVIIGSIPARSVYSTIEAGSSSGDSEPPKDE
jgi:hypothetical protein